MGALRARSSPLAAFLLAILALAGLGFESHDHETLTGALEPAGLPTFAAGHSEPDRSLHVEDATAVTTPSCVACLLRHVPRSPASLPPAFGPRAGGAAVPAPANGPAAIDLARLPASRAPPRI